MNKKQKIRILKELSKGNSEPLQLLQKIGQVVIEHQNDGIPMYNLNGKFLSEDEFETYLSQSKANAMFILPHNNRENEQRTEN